MVTCGQNPIIQALLLNYLLTYAMVQSPSWETNWFAASQEIPRISRNPNVHCRTQKCPPTFSILGQPNPVHIPTFHLLEIHPNIIHPSMPRSPQWSPSLRFPHQDPIHPLSQPIRATCPAHLILLDFITRTILGQGYKSFSSSLCNLLHFPITSSLLGPIILIMALLLAQIHSIPFSRNIKCTESPELCWFFQTLILHCCLRPVLYINMNMQCWKERFKKFIVPVEPKDEFVPVHDMKS